MSRVRSPKLRESHGEPVLQIRLAERMTTTCETERDVSVDFPVEVVEPTVYAHERMPQLRRTDIACDVFFKIRYILQIQNASTRLTDSDNYQNAPDALYS